MLINLIDKNCAKVLLFLAISSGSRYNRKEIKEKTEINNLPLDLALRKLLTFNFVKKEKKLYFLNLDNNLAKIIIEERQRTANLPLKIQFILIDLIEIISKFCGIKNIILFGSYSKLIFTDKSDLDLAIILSKDIKNQVKIEKEIFKQAQKTSKKFKKEIQLHYFIEPDLKHKEDPLIADILRNGIFLI